MTDELSPPTNARAPVASNDASLAGVMRKRVAHGARLPTLQCLKTQHAPRLLLATSLVLCGCASAPSAHESSSTAKLIDVPYVPQQAAFACGLVAAQSLCSFWRVPIDDATLARLEGTAQGQAGLSGTQIRSELDQLGFETFLFHGKLDHSATGVFRHIDAGRPTLLMLSPKPEHGHYVLLIGYDEALKNGSLLDPARGRVLVPYEDLEQSWNATEHFTLLAVPRLPGTELDKKAE